MLNNPPSSGLFRFYEQLYKKNINFIIFFTKNQAVTVEKEQFIAEHLIL
jgi:hypothetical protein